MSDKKLLMHVLRTVRDTHKEKKYGICGEVMHRLKKYYMVSSEFSNKGPSYPARCKAVTRVQTVLYKRMVKWPNGWFGGDDRYSKWAAQRNESEKTIHG